MKKPFAYITAVWKGGEFTVIDQAAVYCRKVYEAGFTRSARFSIFPISCVIPFLPNTRTALTLGVNFCAGAMC